MFLGRPGETSVSGGRQSLTPNISSSPTLPVLCPLLTHFPSVSRKHEEGVVPPRGAPKGEREGVTLGTPEPGPRARKLFADGDRPRLPPTGAQLRRQEQ